MRFFFKGALNLFILSLQITRGDLKASAFLSYATIFNKGNCALCCFFYHFKAHFLMKSDRFLLDYDNFFFYFLCCLEIRHHLKIQKAPNLVWNQPRLKYLNHRMNDLLMKNQGIICGQAANRWLGFVWK